MARNIQGEPTAAGGTFQFHTLTVNRPTVYFAVRVRTPDGSLSPLSNIAAGTPATAAGVLLPRPVGTLSLAASPNPFSPATLLTYNIPGIRSVAYPVTLRVLDISGRQVRTLINAAQPAGMHTIAWNGRDDQGKASAGGIYLFKITVNGKELCRKFAMVK